MLNCKISAFIDVFVEYQSSSTFDPDHFPVLSYKTYKSFTRINMNWEVNLNPSLSIWQEKDTG